MEFVVDELKDPVAAVLLPTIRISTLEIDAAGFETAAVDLCSKVRSVKPLCQTVVCL